MYTKYAQQDWKHLIHNLSNKSTLCSKAVVVDILRHFKQYQEVLFYQTAVNVKVSEANVTIQQSVCHCQWQDVWVHPTVSCVLWAPPAGHEWVVASDLPPPYGAAASTLFASFATHCKCSFLLANFINKLKLLINTLRTAFYWPVHRNIFLLLLLLSCQIYLRLLYNTQLSYSKFQLHS